MDIQRRLRDLFGAFVTGPINVPYHSIAQIDSRMWDPDWNGRYGRSYWDLYRVMMYGVERNSSKAHTLASAESYKWGSRGGAPVGALRPFRNLSPGRVLDKLRLWWRRLTSGDTIEDILNAIGDPLGETQQERPGSPRP